MIRILIQSNPGQYSQNTGLKRNNQGWKFKEGWGRVETVKKGKYVDVIGDNK
jgi:hypothetical protein